MAELVITAIDGYEVLPCPFCGCRAVALRHGNATLETSKWKWISCPNCEANGPSDLGVSGAIEAWNTRQGERAP
jgi:Lar family restriction alleviation protein